MPTEADAPRVTATSRDELRGWLERHHADSDSIWLVTFKQGHPQYLPYDAIVEEALAFGWIDSQPRALDATRSMRRLSPRSPTSKWSRKNRERAEQLIATGRMTAAGQRMVDLAKESGTWTALENVESGLVPDDLRAALRRHAGATANFRGFPPSSKRIILEWIEAAKTAPTRRKRIEETAEKAARGIRANHRPRGPA